jgi:hypothetical protein
MCRHISLTFGSTVIGRPYTLGFLNSVIREMPYVHKITGLLQLCIRFSTGFFNRICFVPICMVHNQVLLYLEIEIFDAAV